LYERYKQWASDNNLKAMNGNAFGLEMKKLYVQRRRNEGNVYFGIGLPENGVPATLFQDEGLHAHETPSEAVSLPFTEESTVGSVPTFYNFPLYKERGTLPTQSIPPSVDASACEGTSGACSPSVQKRETGIHERDWEEFIL
jgi:hypothetical protein